MMIRCTFLAIALLGSTFLFAQGSDDDREIANGLRAGYHLSTLTGDEDLGDRSGYYAGYYRNLIKVPLYSLSTGLEFNTAGAEKDGFEQRLSYVGVPINNRLKLGMLYFDLGLDVAFKVGEKTLVNGTEVDPGEDNEAETLDVLAHAGAGIKFLFLGAEVRYRYGLTEAYEGYRNTGLEIGLTTFF